MSDEIRADADTVEQTPAEGTQESAVPSNEETTGKLIFDKYKTLEDATKGFKETERMIGKQASEIGDLKERLKSFEEKSSLAQALEKISQMTQPKEEKKSIDFDAFMDSLKDEITDNPISAQRKIMAAQSSWMKQTEDSLRSEYEGKLKAIESAVEKKYSELIEKTEMLEPDYVENKPIVDMFVSKGMNIREAKKLAKQAKELLGVKDERITPPSNIASSRSSSASGKVERYLSESDRQAYMRMGLTKEDLDAMEIDEQERRKTWRSE